MVEVMLTQETADSIRRMPETAVRAITSKLRQLQADDAQELRSGRTKVINMPNGGHYHVVKVDGVGTLLIRLNEMKNADRTNPDRYKMFVMAVLPQGSPDNPLAELEELIRVAVH